MCIRDRVETILEFEVTHKATAEMAVAYGFTPRQNEQLALLTGQEYTALWMTLLGGYVNSGGQIIDCLLYTSLLTPHRLVFRAENLYYTVMRAKIDAGARRPERESEVCR